MSGVLENRAASFSRQPQSVEVYQAGAWWAGELLGWRHDDAGNCQVQVRVVLGGVAETAWTDLSTLRLPDRRLSVAPAPAPALVAAPERWQMSSAHPAGSRRHRTDDHAATASLPPVRDLSVVPIDGASRPGGRRRAPEGLPTVVAPRPQSSVGRHRAPAPGQTDPGRHRTADTGFLPAVVQSSGGPRRGVARPSIPQARSARAEEMAGGREEAEPDLFTRPMRLSDYSARAGRRPRVDGSLSNA